MAILSVFIISQIIEIEIDSVALDSVYYRYEPIESVFAITVPSEFYINEEAYIDREELDINGSKNFSFDINDGFDQGLDLKVAGKIEGIEIEGNLSDQSMPENTIALSEVEKINLQLKGPGFYAGVGDLTLHLPFGLQDNITGVRAATFKDRNTIGLGYAVNRGAYTQEIFLGEEGKQSPYILNGRVIPGSETVYLSKGISLPIRLMKEIDYNLDYEQGVISITNRHIINALCRIIVEYQQANENYANTYYLTDGNLCNGPFTWTALYRVDQDNRDTPLAFSLTPDEIQNLESSGDSARIYHTYADSSAQGNYRIQDSHFVYVGENNGDFLVNFFYAGDNNGEYIYDPVIKAFNYLGPGLGNYSPKQLLPLPKSLIFYGIGGEYDQAVYVDILGSEYDHNTFSRIDDRDNRGFGTLMKIKKTWARFGINANYVYYDPDYRSPVAESDIDHQYQWNTVDPIQYLAYTELMFKPLERFSCEAGYGVLNGDHQRRTIRIRPLIFELGMDIIDTLNRYYAGLETNIRRLSLTGNYQHSQHTDQANLKVYYNLSDHDHLGIITSYDADDGNRGFTTSMEWISRPLSVRLGQRWYNDTSYIFGNTSFRFYRNGWTANGNVEQSQRYWQKKDEQYIKVQSGQGNYVYDPVTGTYLEKPGGDYIRKLVFLPEYEKITARNLAIEGGYSSSIFELLTRVRYIDEINFKSINTQLINSIALDDIDIEIDISQEINDDRRYALAGIWTQYRSLAFAPYFQRLILHFDANDKIEKQNEFTKEKRTEFGGSIAYRIGDIITCQPLAGYYYNTFYSEFFPDLNIIMQKPVLSLLIAVPFIKKGRAEIIGDLNYRFFNIDSVPYFYTANEPSGLEKIITVNLSLNAGSNTLLSTNYRLDMPPDNNIRHNFKLQARIDF
ncbi:hypothetical protein A2Y85_03575 [candidate division WOR-3 bacterium RBG_13_43_14]|uniref:Uncharacterized protein n=1 Tax=candidate division WOR-3 bacterium RBG_13_43_14 TaxID=1802590 RepID=A0A1F4UE77_UNCW3|nr:MAG: hypothetical protein A2Y85_03575 [candidate division WOR-3 bacterium RBG_13_43_14]